MERVQEPMKPADPFRNLGTPQPPQYPGLVYKIPRGILMLSTFDILLSLVYSLRCPLKFHRRICDVIGV